MESLPPGFRFHPTDEELITYYLTRKVSDFCFVSTAIADVDLNKCEPWDLPAKSTMGEKEWYFFSLRDRKYPTGLRTNRATDAGYWKTTGKDKEIFHSGVLVGLKKTLVFYRGRAPKGEKSNWVMHEYRLESKFSFKPNKEEWVVCRVFQKSSTTKNKLQHTSSFHSSSSLDQPPCDTTTLNELGEIELPNSNSITNSSSGLSTFSNQSNNDSNINMNMSWASAARGTTNNNLISASWPSNLLTSNTSMNSLLLRALQLGSYRQPRDNTSSDLNSMLTLGDYRFGTDINASLTTASSSNIVVDTTQQLPQFNQESMW